MARSTTRPTDIAIPATARMTRQRRAVVEAIRSGGTSFTAVDVYDRARKLEAGVSLATVYRTIELLRRTDAVRPLAGSERGEYVCCSPGHHHHLICLSCGSVEETELCAAPDDEELRRQHGFTPSSHELDVYGTCAACGAA